MTTSSVVIMGTINASQDGTILSPNGISDTHTSGHGNCPKVLCVVDADT